MSAAKLRALGWAPGISLEDGIASTYRWYLESLAETVDSPA
jgi:GDP-L-fucose synthase